MLGSFRLPKNAEQDRAGRGLRGVSRPWEPDSCRLLGAFGPEGLAHLPWIGIQTVQERWFGPFLRMVGEVRMIPLLPSFGLQECCWANH